MMSFMVVIKGPVARAGSIFNLFRSNGIMVPNSAAKIITTKREELTVNVSARLSLIKKL